MKVQLSLQAKKLPNVAGAFKGTSDPYAVVTLMCTEPGEKPSVLGKTEVIKNTLNPDWTKMFIFDFELGKPTHISVGVYDEVSKGDNKSMGSAVFEIGSVLGSKGNVKAKKMKGGGTIYARFQKNVGSGSLKLKMRGHKLTNVEGFFKKSDPFYEMERQDNDPRGATWDNVFRSNFVKDNLSPIWDEAVIELSTLCGGDSDRPIQIVVYDHEKSGKHVLMGSFETTVNGLVAAQGSVNSFTLMKKGKRTGQIFVESAQVVGLEGELTEKMAAASVSDEPAAVPARAAAVLAPAVSGYPSAPVSTQPDFVDYISGGCELNLCVAIDFTGSNGDPRIPGTLHHITQDGSKNDYEKVISSLGTIMANYDSDQKYPVWGFGAKYDGVVRHCFQCGPTPTVSGVNGVLEAYRAVFRSGLIMSGPTVFTEVIETAASGAVSAQEAASQLGLQAYTILLILTDGSVSDINATAAALDQVSDSPLSVVIVGIGQADFRGMRFLDDYRAASGGKRDIAQFVEFNKHKQSVRSFTEAALNEVPEQLVGYFSKRGIMPLPPMQRQDDEIVIEPYNEDEEIDLSLSFRDDGDIVVSGGGNYKVQTF